MRTIDITTTQKVTIQYELAGLRDRGLAYILDFFIVGTGILILSLLYYGAFGYENDNLFTYLLVWPIVIFYTVTMEYVNNGQTLGKSIMGIKVIKLDGKAPSFSDYMTRWAFRPIDIYLSFGSIASLLVSSSDKAQRLGDLTANTTLIKVRFHLRFRLEDIENISTLSQYEPLYPQVRQLNEEDMLLIKSVISRVQKHNNKAHLSVLDQLVNDLRLTLDITDQPKNQVEFLKSLIKDYIVLTR